MPSDQLVAKPSLSARRPVPTLILSDSDDSPNEPGTKRKSAGSAAQPVKKRKTIRTLNALRAALTENRVAVFLEALVRGRPLSGELRCAPIQKGLSTMRPVHGEVIVEVQAQEKRIKDKLAAADSLKNKLALMIEKSSSSSELKNRAAFAFDTLSVLADFSIPDETKAQLNYGRPERTYKDKKEDEQTAKYVDGLKRAVETLKIDLRKERERAETLEQDFLYISDRAGDAVRQAHGTVDFMRGRLSVPSEAELQQYHRSLHHTTLMNLEDIHAGSIKRLAKLRSWGFVRTPPKPRWT